jgi:hypothetical protein
MTHPPSVVGLGFVRDGRALLTVGWDGSARVWGTEGAGRGLAVPIDSGLQNATFTSRREAILTGDRYNRRAQVVDLRAGGTVGETYDDAIAAGQQLLVARRVPTGLAIRDLRSGKDVATLASPSLTARTVQEGRVSRSVGLQSIRLSPDGRYLCAFSSEEEPQLWDVRSAKRIALPEVQPTLGVDRGRLDVAFSRDGTLLAIRDSVKSILAYSLPEGRLVARLNVNESASGLEFSADGKYLATTDGFNLWEVRAPQRRLTAIPAAIGRGDATFSPDGRFLVHFDKVWALPSSPVLTLDGTSEQVTFNDSSTTLAVRDRRTVTLWDIAGKRRLARLALRESGSAVAFSPDGEHVATTDGNFVRIWSMDGREVARIEHLSRVTRVAFGAGGDLLSFARVTADGESAVHLLLWRPEQLIGEACQRLTRNLDPDEWREYIGAEPYRKTCPNIR